MPDSESKPDRAAESRSRFATTHWSIVARAGSNASQAGPALAALCESYWFPLYAFVRRLGHSPDDAQDLTQEFFARLLAKNYLSAVDRSRGRFRSFLLGAMKHFLAKNRRRQTALKRGGRRPMLSLDFRDGEDRYALIEPADNFTPERLFERRWALTLLDLVLTKLREEYCTKDKLVLFDELKQFLPGGTAEPAYLDVGKRLCMSESAVKTAVHRLRRRYRKLLEAEIARTVDTPEEVEDELHQLLAALCM